MIYDFSLKATGIVTGILLLASHAFALGKPSLTKAWLKDFPRSRAAGLTLLIIATVWAFWLIATIDMGEFSNLRKPLLLFIPVGAFLSARFVDEFLSVRCLGILALLATEPLLESAFLKPEQSRLILVMLAYIWATAGIFWVGLPYLLRDQIGWVTANSNRWKLFAGGGAVYGLVLFVAAWTWNS